MFTAPGKVGAAAVMSLRMTTCTVRVAEFVPEPIVPVAARITTPLVSFFHGVGEVPPESWATPVISASPAAQSLRSLTENEPAIPATVTPVQAAGVAQPVDEEDEQAVALARSVLQSLLLASWSNAHSMPASARNRAWVLSVRFCEI